MDTKQFGDYVNNLRAFLLETLAKIIRTEDLNKYVSNEAMKVWIKAFTHDTDTADVRRNNDTMEFLGDKTINLCFSDYLLSMFAKSNLTSAAYTNMVGHYMGGKFQHALSKKLGLLPYVRRDPIITELYNIEKDSVEAFFGALFRVSDLIVGNNTRGLGYGNCFNMLVYLFRDEKIDLAIKRGIPKQVVNQLLKGFKAGISDGNTQLAVTTTNYGPIREELKIAFTPSQITFLTNQGIEIKDPVLAKGMIVSTDKTAAAGIYEIAVNKLENLGLTEEKITEMREYLDTHTTDIISYYDRVLDKVKAEGYVKFLFRFPGKESNKSGTYGQLLGVSKDGTQKILLSSFISRTQISDDEARSAVKVDLVNRYIGIIK